MAEKEGRGTAPPGIMDKIKGSCVDLLLYIALTNKSQKAGEGSIQRLTLWPVFCLKKKVGNELAGAQEQIQDLKT